MVDAAGGMLPSVVEGKVRRLFKLNLVSPNLKHSPCSPNRRPVTDRPRCRFKFGQVDSPYLG